jgi:hypothetical protein
MGTGPNAIQDILNNPRFQGSISSIKWLTQIVDSYFAMFISVVAFFIISAAILRNVVAGAYAAYPKLFDMVAEAKEAGLAKVQGQRMSGVAIFLLRLIPNFKSMSDFHDNTVEPRHYFIRAVPQSMVVVIIGVFIYNGYYRDTVAVAANFGATLISTALTDVDPTVWFDKLTNLATDPVWATDGDNSLKGKTINGISKDIYSDIVSFYTDISSEQSKSSLAQQIEPYVTNQLMQYSQYLKDNNAYSVSYQVDRVLGQPNLNDINNQTIDNVTTEAFSVPVSQFNIQSTQHKGENWYIRVVLRFTQNATSVGNINNLSGIELTVPSNAVVSQSDGVIIPIPSPVNGCSLTPSGTITIGQYTGKVVSGGIELVNAPSSVLNTTLSPVSGLYYETSTNMVEGIGSINLSGSGDGTSSSQWVFSDPSNTVSSFTWGQIPQGNTSTQSSSSSTTQTTTTATP